MTNPAAHITAASATVGSALGLVFNVLPPLLAALASLAAVVWYAVQIYESATFQAWLVKRRKT